MVASWFAYSVPNWWKREPFRKGTKVNINESSAPLRSMPVALYQMMSTRRSAQLRTALISVTLHALDGSSLLHWMGRGCFEGTDDWT